VYFLKGIDFGEINEVMDFYIIGFDKFNECNAALLNGGITPMDSKDTNINTLVRFVLNTRQKSVQEL